MTKLADVTCAICPHYGTCRWLEFKPEYRIAFCIYVPCKREVKTTYERHNKPRLIPEPEFIYIDNLHDYLYQHQQ